jgi:hypothetical protein
VRSDRIVRKHLRARFIVTMKAGETWSGVLLDTDRLTLCLADVSAISPDGQATPADGQVFLPRVDVAYMQRA